MEAQRAKGPPIVIEIILVEHEGATIDVEIKTSVGIVEILCDYRMVDRGLLILDAHIQGLSPGALGRRGLNEIAQALREQADADTIEIQGAVRTTGRSKGRRPRVIRATRRPRS